MCKGYFFLYVSCTLFGNHIPYSEWDLELEFHFPGDILKERNTLGSLSKNVDLNYLISHNCTCLKDYYNIETNIKKTPKKQKQTNTHTHQS